MLASVIVKPSFAAKPVKLVYATVEQVQQMIDEAISPIQNAVNSLTGRVTTTENNQTQQTNQLTDIKTTISPIPGLITTLQNKVSSHEATINNLNARLSELENTQPPTPYDFVFFNNQEVPLQGYVFSSSFDATGYSKIVFTYQCYEQGTQILLLVSNDQINNAATYTVNPDQCHQGGSVTLDIAGKYYSTYIGNNTNVVNPRPSVYAIGRFK
jgi:septal ring factor EnvC (AmiA/AmiB activator)